MSSDEKCCHTYGPSTPSVYQTLDEIDFERGIWNLAIYGETSKLRERLDKGVDPSVRDSSGYTALHYASRNGKKRACALLLERGANPNAQTHGGSTPLHRAALQGHEYIVQLLIKYRANPCICDSDGKTALHKAAEGNHLEICRILVDLKPELKAMKDNKGCIALSYANPEFCEFTNLLAV